MEEYTLWDKYHAGVSTLHCWTLRERGEGIQSDTPQNDFHKSQITTDALDLKATGRYGSYSELNGSYPAGRPTDYYVSILKIKVWLWSLIICRETEWSAVLRGASSAPVSCEVASRVYFALLANIVGLIHVKLVPLPRNARLFWSYTKDRLTCRSLHI